MINDSPIMLPSLPLDGAAAGDVLWLVDRHPDFAGPYLRAALAATVASWYGEDEPVLAALADCQFVGRQAAFEAAQRARVAAPLYARGPIEYLIDWLLAQS